MIKELFNNPMAVTAMLVGVVGLFVLIHFGLSKWYERLVENGTHPVLVEAVRRTIVQIYRLNERVMDETNTRLHGVDKKRLAKDSYWLVHELLPEKWSMPWLPISFPLKKWFLKYVTMEKWSAWVQAEWDRLMLNWDKFTDMARDELEPDTLPNW